MCNASLVPNKILKEELEEIDLGEPNNTVNKACSISHLGKIQCTYRTVDHRSCHKANLWPPFFLSDFKFTALEGSNPGSEAEIDF